ncbi:MAG: hypothetical protein P8J32_03945, partial [bacterium]|nr:hypothetical protein [bacterium]
QEGTPEERKVLARQMAEEALSLMPSNFETLPTDELAANKHFLVTEAIRSYKEQSDDSEDKSMAA